MRPAREDARACRRKPVANGLDRLSVRGEPVAHEGVELLVLGYGLRLLQRGARSFGIVVREIESALHKSFDAGRAVKPEHLVADDPIGLFTGPG